MMSLIKIVCLFLAFLALFNRFINLKNSNPNVKLLIAMGGWNEGSTTYSAVGVLSRLFGQIHKLTNEIRNYVGSCFIIETSEICAKCL